MSGRREATPTKPMNTTNYHLFEVKYIPATDKLGSRVKITGGRYGTSKLIPYDYQLTLSTSFLVQIAC